MTPWCLQFPAEEVRSAHLAAAVGYAVSGWALSVRVS